MSKIIVWLYLALSATPLLAQTSSSAEAPVESAGPFSAVIFGILFFGICIGFIWMIWRSDKKSEAPEKDK